MLRKLHFENLALFKGRFEIEVCDDGNKISSQEEQTAVTGNISEHSPSYSRGKRKRINQGGSGILIKRSRSISSQMAELSITKYDQIYKWPFVILMGENGSGKSCIFEIIRRCLSSEISKSFSRVPDNERQAYAICRFVLGEELLRGKNAIAPIKQLSSDTPFRDPIISLVESSEFYVDAGIIYEKDSGERYRMLILSEKSNEPSIMLLQDLKKKTTFILDVRKTKHLVDFIKDPCQTTASDLLEFLKNASTKRSSDTRSKSSIPQDFFIMEFYHCLFGMEGFVKFVFPHRGIGPMDSSVCHKMEQDRGNYADTIARADLLLKLLPEEETPEFQRYMEISQQLLGHRRYKFSRKNVSDGRSQIVFKETVGDSGNEVELDLLKIPEGIYETHLFSLVIARAGAGETLCLDEPNRCLHPSVVENMREFILHTTSANPITLLLTTHAPSFISKDTWRHVYRISRTEDGYSTCKELGNFTYKIINRISSPDFRDILLSNTILFVEGYRDGILLRTLISKIICERKKVWEVFGEGLQKQFGEDSFISEASLVSIGKIKVFEIEGVNNWHNLGIFCQEAEIPFGILFDQDKQTPGLDHLTIPQNELQWKLRLALLKFINLSNRRSKGKFMKKIKEASNDILKRSTQSSKDDFMVLIEVLLSIEKPNKEHRDKAFDHFCNEIGILKNQLEESSHLLRTCNCLFAWEKDLEDFLEKVMPSEVVQKNTKGDQRRTTMAQRVHIFEQLLQSKDREKEKVLQFLEFLLRLSGAKGEK